MSRKLENGNREEKKIYFISGVCGVGKSSIMPHLRKILGDTFEVRDFDERGVPDGADHSWRMSEVKKWLEVGEDLLRENKTLVVCGFVKKKDFEGDNLPVEIIVLDADAETIRKRLMNRYSKDGIFDETIKVIGKPVNEFIESNVYYCKIMREECTKDGCKIIDTFHLSPEQVAGEVALVMKK